MKKFKKIFSVFYLISWFIIIFLFSHTPSDASDEQSKKIVNQIIGTTNQTIEQPANSPKEEFENDKPIEQNEENMQFEYLNYLVRKIAHISEYFILALLVLNVIYNFKAELKLKYYIITILSCFAYAITDEVHQIFVPRESWTS